MISREDITGMQDDLPPLPPVIGLAGAAGAGKSTAALAMLDIVNDDPGLAAAIVKFAHPLKTMMAALYAAVGLRPAEIIRRIEGDLKQTTDPILMGATPRMAMQRLGTDWGRRLIHPDLWTHLWQLEVERQQQRLAAGGPAGITIITDDVRFENEVAAIKAAGGVVIGILGPRVDSALAKDEAGHESEAGVGAAAIDAIVINGPGTTPCQLAGLVLDAAAEAAAHPLSESSRTTAERPPALRRPS